MMNVHPSPQSARTPDGHAEAGPPQWMFDLERAHDRLGRATHLLESAAQSGPVDLRPGAQLLSQVFGAIFDAYDERRARFEAIGDGVTWLDQAVASLSPAANGDAAVGFALDYLQEVRAALLQASERVAHLIRKPPPEAPDIRAGFERPPLHAIDRPSIVPHLRVPEPKPPEVEAPAPLPERPKTFEDLERIARQLREAALAPKPLRKKPAKPPPAEPAEPPAGFARDIQPALSSQKFVFECVRQCFEEITMIGVQRAPLLGDPWRSSRVLERRMVASIDAIAAMGPEAFGALESLVLESPLKDPPRVFGIAMTLGCVAGRDALALAERVFAALELDDPDHVTHLGAALKLVPHPHLPMVLRTFLAHPDAARRALAIDVLGYRGMVTHEELTQASQDEPDVVAAVLPWLALKRHPALRETIDASKEVPHPRVRSAALLAMVLGGDSRAVRYLRRALEAEPAEAEAAASLLGVVGGREEADLLLERAQSAPTRASVAAVGWAGSVAAVVPLIELLGHDDEDVILAAAYALDRITHAGLHEDAIVEADEIVAPDVPEPDVGDGPPPLARVVSDPRDMPAEPSTETLRRPSTDPERWQAWWQERREAFEPKARWRRGSPYTPLVSWRELDQWRCTPGERRLLQTELVARTGDYVRFDTHDFVRAQEEAIAAWEPIARRASGSPGSWHLPGRRDPLG
jgi:HEAT repeat protein